MKTTVVNLYKKSYDIYIGRAGKGKSGYFGNPIKLKPGEPKGSTIEKYKEYFYNRINTDPEFRNKVHELKGKKLGCFCKPKPCHGDIIAEYLNAVIKCDGCGDSVQYSDTHPDYDENNNLQKGIRLCYDCKYGDDHYNYTR